MIPRDVRKNEPKWGLCDPEELEDQLDTTCASRDTFDEMELRELNMMRLPSCVVAQTVFETGSRETMLVIARQTNRNPCLPSEHVFFPVQIRVPLGFGPTPRKSESKLW